MYGREGSCSRSLFTARTCRLLPFSIANEPEQVIHRCARKRILWRIHFAIFLFSFFFFRAYSTVHRVTTIKYRFEFPLFVVYVHISRDNESVAEGGQFFEKFGRESFICICTKDCLFIRWIEKCVSYECIRDNICFRVVAATAVYILISILGTGVDVSRSS